MCISCNLEIQKQMCSGVVELVKQNENTVVLCILCISYILCNQCNVELSRLLTAGDI